MPREKSSDSVSARPPFGVDNIWLDENSLAGGMDWTDGTQIKTRCKA
jgi:hypothetical protein